MKNQAKTHNDYGLSPLVEPLKASLEYRKFVERLPRTDLVVVPQLRRTDLVVIPFPEPET